MAPATKLFDPLRDLPPEEVPAAAAQLLAGAEGWLDFVQAALAVSDDEFIERALPEYVHEVEPKVFLLHDEPGRFQAVLHHFDVETFRQLLAERRLGPHFHHFSFSTRILHGHYVQWLFRNEGSLFEPKLHFDRQIGCPANSVYTLAHDRYHCVFTPKEDTMSLMIRGPARFKPRGPCARSAAVEETMVARLRRMRTAVSRVAAVGADVLDLDGPAAGRRAQAS